MDNEKGNKSGDNFEFDQETFDETNSSESFLQDEMKESELGQMDQKDESGQDSLEESQFTEKNDNGFWKELFSWVKVIVFAILLTLVINKYVIFVFTVPTESMENTIMVDNRIMSFRGAYWFSDPKRLDIVVFPFPDDPSETYIKRVIGLPGETIEGIDGLVYIDGKPLDEKDYVTSDLDEDFGPYKIPDDSYFVLGDNRDVSKDARYWEDKFVKKKDIISKAIMKFYPGIKILK